MGISNNNNNNSHNKGEGTNDLISNTSGEISDDVFDLIGFDDVDLSYIGGLVGSGFDDFESNKLEETLIKYGVISGETDDDMIIDFGGYEAHFYTLMGYITKEIQRLDIGEELPEDIINVSYKSNTYLNKLSGEIDKKVSNIISSNSTTLFNDISDLFDLLYLGRNFNILENYNNYNFENIECVMDNYNNLLIEYQNNNDSEKFEYIFKLYTTFIDLLNRLCTLNSNDIQRKKTIEPILDLIQFKTNESKMSTNYDASHLNVLNNFLGKFMINFSHIKYIDSDGKNIDEVISSFSDILVRQTLGFTLCENNNFGNNPGTRDSVRYALLGNISYLLLSLIRKLNHKFPNVDIYNNETFITKIYNLYFEFKREVGLGIYQSNSINSFSADLESNLIFLYELGNEGGPGIQINNDKGVTTTSNVFNHFYYDNKDISSDDMEIIHHLTLFNHSDNIDDNLHLLDKLLKLSKFNNDNLEFYKLKTIDIILNLINRQDNKNRFINEIDRIINYIESNNKGSHLLSAYSKIYISLALYFSDFGNHEYINKSKDYYSNFLNINGYELLEKEYISYHNRLLINYGNFEAIKQGQTNINNNDIFLSIGKRTTELHEESREYRIKNEINEDITNLVNNTMEKDGLNDKEVIDTIESFISNKIFLGVTNVYISGISNDEIPKIDRGYDIKSLIIHDEVKLNFIYPKFYKDTFDFIFSRNEKYLSINIKNIVLGYMSKRETFIDNITELPNSRKLLGDLAKVVDTEKSFLYEIDIKGIDKINKQKGHKIGDEVFRTISDKIADKFYLGTLYRLNGVRLGLFMNNFDGLGGYDSLSFDDIEDDIVTEIHSIIDTIMRSNDIQNSGVTIGIGGGKGEDVLVNSSLALKEALHSNSRYGTKINY